MTVLVIDDDPDIRFLMSHVLRGANFDVVEAKNGPEALSYLATHELPDLAILDVQMPEMDGWQTLTAIRNDPRTADLPVVLCTVKATPENVARGWDLQADGYMGKPFKAEQLVEEVRLVLSRSSGEREQVRLAELAKAREAGDVNSLATVARSGLARS